MTETLPSGPSASTNSAGIDQPTTRPVTHLPILNGSNTQNTTSRPLEVILSSPKCPDDYHEPVWRILDAMERIKRLLKLADDGAGEGAGGGLAAVKGLELRAVWIQLEIIGDVVGKFVSEVDASLLKTKALVKVTQKVGQGDKAQDLPLLFELLNLDDMLKGMHHLPSYSITIHVGIVSQLTRLSTLCSGNSSPISPVAVVAAGPPASPSGTSIHSFTHTIQPAEVLELLKQHINTLNRLVQSSNTLLSLNRTIKTQHTQLSWRLQHRVMGSISKQNQPTTDILRNLAAALRIIRSAAFPPDEEGGAISAVEEIRARNDTYYRSLIPLIRQAKNHIQAIDDQGLSRNMGMNKDIVLPFYLELVRYTRGMVDESPLSKLGNERGLGVGNEVKSETAGGADAPRCSTSSGLTPGGLGRQLSRRLSLSAGTALAGSVLGVGKGGFREGVKGWVRGSEVEEGKRKSSGGFKGMLARWSGGGSKTPVVPPPSSIPKTTSDLTGTIPTEKHNTLRRKHKSTNLSDSFLALSLSSLSAQSSKQQSSTDSLGGALSNSTTATTKSGLCGSRDGKEKFKKEAKWISDDHQKAQSEWEELAGLVNAQKCMCRTGWMVGGVQHLRGRDGMGSGAMYGR